MNQENKDFSEELLEQESAEVQEDRVLIEESDAGRRRREAAEAEPQKSKAKPWLIATAAVVLLGIIAGLSVYFVQQRRNSDVYERTISTITTEKATTTTEEEFEIEDSDDIVISGDDAIGGEMGVAEEAEIRTETTSELNEEDADDEDADEDDSTKKTTKKTTRRTTRRTTVWNARDLEKAYEDFWNGVSKAVS